MEYPEQEKILNYLKINGPSLPAEIKNAVGIDLIILGAILSEMARSKQILMSIGKIGGSNLYYLPGQEEKLKRLYNYLKEPEKEIFKKLENEKILDEKSLSPVESIAITKIPDFAKRIEVEINNEKIVFWKWYLLDDESFKKLLEEKFNQNNNIQEKSKEIDNEKATKDNLEEKTKVIEEKEKKTVDEKPNEEKTKTILKKHYEQILHENENLVKNLKVKNQNNIIEFLNEKNIVIKSLLMNAQNYAILLAENDLMKFVLAIHDKKTISENDIILLLGYCSLHNLSGILICSTFLKSNVMEVAKKASIQIFNIKNKEIVKIL
ncbi:MAG: hypothetical protein QXR30_04550 [Candidatus Woesearchaeota archaeon]